MTIIPGSVRVMLSSGRDYKVSPMFGGLTGACYPAVIIVIQ